MSETLTGRTDQELLKKLIDDISQFGDGGLEFQTREIEQILKWVMRLDDLINSPELQDFIKGLKLESAHQTEKWGSEHEETKFPHDYALVLDKLKGKQALAIWDLDVEKYKHHLITMAAVCYNMHRQIDKPGTILNEFFTNKPKDEQNRNQTTTR